MAFGWSEVYGAAVLPMTQVESGCLTVFTLATD